eukprot:COSAG01_NODE_17605_length_1137_cov_6.228324_1_plen_96_part_00
MARGHAIEAVLGEFIDDCVDLQKDGGQLAAYGMEFDATTIYCELQRLPKLRHHCPFLICWPLTFAFIDYRAGAAATVFLATAQKLLVAGGPSTTS